MSSNENAAIAVRGQVRNTDLLSLLKIIWKRKAMILVIASLAGLVSYLINSYLIPATYRSSFTAYVNNRTDAASSNTEALTSGDTTAAQSLTYTYAEILRSDPILERAAADIGMDFQHTDLSRIVSTSIGENTQLVYVYVTMESPEQACDYARAIARIAPVYLEGIVEGTSMKIVSSPRVPDRQFEPNIRRNTVVAVMAGVLLGMLLAVFIEMTNTVINSKEELQDLFDLPIIGTIPNFVSEAGHSYGGKYGYGYGRNTGRTDGQE